VESFNNELKQTYFEAKRFDILSFFTIAKRMIKDFSCDMVTFPKTLEAPIIEWQLGLSLCKFAIKELKKNTFAFIKKGREFEKRDEREK